MRFIVVALSTMSFATPAFAYIGPGAGLGAIAALAAIVGGVLLLLIGFLWYPIKRIIRSRQNVKKK